MSISKYFLTLDLSMSICCCDPALKTNHGLIGITGVFVAGALVPDFIKATINLGSNPSATGLGSPIAA